MRLDYNSELPSGMKEYLEVYGWHFSKKMAEWASSNMYKVTNGSKESIVPYTKESLNTLKERFGVSFNAKGYDDVYIANMCKADFLGSSVKDDAHLVLYVKNVIDDPDAYEGMPFTRFYADCIGSGTPIMWEDMI
jgi:hypothetical protein